MLVLSVLTAAPAPARPLQPFEYQQVHMGLPVRILLHAPDEPRAAAAARKAFARIETLDHMMSDYRPDSELRGLASAWGTWRPASSELLDVLATALTVARETEGAFDPTVGPLVSLWRESRRTHRLPDTDALNSARDVVGWPHLEIDRARGAIRLAKSGMQLDLGGIAKGYILQEALRSLQGNGFDRVLVASGGDVVTGNPPPGRPGWRIRADGAHPDFVRRASALSNAALATSGSTEQFVEIDGIRYSHIVDPRTGLGIRHQRLARVIAADAAIADALATAVAVAGAGVVSKLRKRHPELEISVVYARGSDVGPDRLLRGGPSHRR